MRYPRFPITIAAFAAFSALLHAESPYLREFNLLQEQRDKAVTAAIEPVNRRYQASLEQLMRKATQANDLDTATRIKQSLASTTATSGASVANDSFLGKWVFRSGVWSDSRELKSDGWVICKADGVGKWAVNGTELKIDFPNGRWVVLTLPVRNGKLHGKTITGEQMTAEKVENQ